MQGSQRHLTFFTLGTATWDDAVCVSGAGGFGDTKFNCEFEYEQAGGSAVNTRLALQAVAEAFETKSDTWLCTKLGHSVPQNRFKNLVIEQIGDHHLMDAAFMRDDYAVPKNRIIINQSGRMVLRGKQQVNTPFDDLIIKEIIEAVSKSDLLILHSRYPQLTEIAATTAKDKGIKVILDYSEKDQSLVERLENVIHLSDYVLTPHDARLPGMTEDNPDVLFDRLVGDYGKTFVAVSNSSEPVKIFSGGQRTTVQPEHVKAIDLNGAGDVKDAAFGFFVAKGSDPLVAYQKATVIATFSVQYPGREWIPHLKDHLQNHPLFAQDFTVQQNHDNRAAFSASAEMPVFAPQNG